MNATVGYAEAIHLLKQHLGNDFKITTAYIEKALKWSSIEQMTERLFTAMLFIYKPVAMQSKIFHT